MKKIILQSAVLATLLLACACSQSDNNKKASISIDDAQYVTFDQCISDVSLIPLELERPIGDIFELYVTGNETLLSTFDGEIFYFRDGRQVSVLSSVGRGHGEYIDLLLFRYFKKLGLIALSDRANPQLYIYSVPSMEFVKVIKLDEYPSSMTVYDDSCLVWLGSESFNKLNIVSGESQKVIETSWRTANGAMVALYSFSKSNNLLPLCDKKNILYKVNEDFSLVPFVEVDFGSDGLPEKYKTDKGDSMNKMMASARYTMSHNYLISPIRARLLDDGFEFWYVNKNSPDGDNDYNRYYRRQGDREWQLKGFLLPGMKEQQLDHGVTDDGYSYMVYSGPSEVLRNPDEEPCELAQKIFDAVDAQPDYAPVLMKYKFKP